MLKESAGILIIWENKALLAHSTNSPWWRSYTPPKGGIEKGENEAEAASREVLEEVGIFIHPEQLDEKVEVEYRDRSDRLYKVVHMFIYRIASLDEIGLEEESVPFSQLQREEIDDAKFMDVSTIEKKVLPRYYEYIKKVINEKI
jgi:ADP-ribose pyrophosphatase YjhB (NUDIX family)